MRTVTVLGATGVIGTHTLEVVDRFPDAFTVVALTAGRNVERLAELVRRYRPRFVAVAEAEGARWLRERLRQDGLPMPEIGVGREGLVAAAEVPSDVVVSAVVGAAGLPAAWAALARGAVLALANKETLVTAGDLVMAVARRHGGSIVPVDSEHSALFQCLMGSRREDVRRLLLTASGGPFRTWPKERLAQVTVEEALRHPNWAMGRKITVDSATLMNKGLEVIEAHHLFAAEYDDIEVLVHPQSVVHSLVEYRDGSMLAQLAPPDMRLPIQYALMHPARPENDWPRLDLTTSGALTFEPPDLERFPCLRLAYDAGRAGGYAPCVLNAANEVAVEAFLEGRLPFNGIARVVESVLERHITGTPRELNDIVEMDAWARGEARSAVRKGGWGA
ncbi:1-deoxy-D-xylulose-5-phosphate reductoisomerase [Alicyclobacillus sp.]|uniref:1-deoxy-D-xylulose-5-phosphate reductoisomerase n=1 Tax=Alicyclobacillus sp. TaxID=61169 RepID=UPI0025C66BBE|nr:1-deoxy-D-xylulose-5-phosphate reductoisomerase [Alicyclobacillus sp.]MCL6515607.1 1-deoxy-D-xylulose-5-phosphate reductoisomerase [Alicyclobacillus sp.]